MHINLSEPERNEIKSEEIKYQKFTYKTGMNHGFSLLYTLIQPD